MGVRTRFQWPTVGDTLQLEMYNYAGNLPSDVVVNHVNIFRMNQEVANDVNPLGLLLVEGPVAASQIGTGQYRVTLDLTPGVYAAAEYKDIWTITYPNGVSGQRDFGFTVYAERQAAVTYPPTITWAVSTSPRKVHYDSVFRLMSRVKPAEITDNCAAEEWTNMLNAGAVELKIVRTSSVYDYVPCEEGGNDDVNASLQWTPIYDRGDGIYPFLIDTSSSGLNMYPGEYRLLYRITFGDTIWYSTEKQMLQITR